MPTTPAKLHRDALQTLKEYDLRDVLEALCSTHGARAIAKEIRTLPALSQKVRELL
ncbi:MAG: hypothetical protein F6K04_11225 [Leptolyngbya sp. SIO4C5]|nr:hypothetical protein [Leptolyngbya sp. SIO4C5]